MNTHAQRAVHGNCKRLKCELEENSTLYRCKCINNAFERGKFPQAHMNTLYVTALTAGYGCNKYVYALGV